MMTSIRENAGGMNDRAGFPVFFTKVSEHLGRYDEYGDIARQIADLFPPSLYPTAVDICCGIGKMSHALANCGYKTLGIDLSAEQLEIARQISPGPDYVRTDMGALPPGQYDLLLNIYTSFGYYNTEEEDLAVLSEWYKALRPGGVLIMELADMDRARNRIDNSGCLIRINQGVTEYLFMDWDKQLLTVDYEKDEMNWSCVTRLYEKEVLRSALLKARFKTVEIYGSFDRRPKHEDNNLILIAQKGLS